jgi:nitroreductase
MAEEESMSTTAQSVALAEAARVGGYAPSIHNTQPWRWRVRGDVLELHADRQRQLAITDPQGRLLTISCGIALHHARVALAAEGWQHTVARSPDPRDPSLLAWITATERTPVSPDALRLLQTIRIRHTDRRPVSSTPVAAEALDALRRVTQKEGARLHILRPDDIIEIAGAAAHAQRVEDLDPEWVDEMTYWVSGAGGDGLGLPDDVIPSEPPQTTVPGRRFGHDGALPIGEGHDSAAIYAILYADEDTPLAWLTGGEACSALWLEAIEHGLSVLPLSGAVEVPQTRLIVRRLLANLGEPLLILRLGIADPDHAGPPHTPRLPADQTVEIA